MSRALGQPTPWQAAALIAVFLSTSAAFSQTRSDADEGPELEPLSYDIRTDIHNLGHYPPTEEIAVKGNLVPRHADTSQLFSALTIVNLDAPALRAVMKEHVSGRILDLMAADSIPGRQGPAPAKTPSVDERKPWSSLNNRLALQSSRDSAPVALRTHQADFVVADEARLWTSARVVDRPTSPELTRGTPLPRRSKKNPSILGSLVNWRTDHLARLLDRTMNGLNLAVAGIVLLGIIWVVDRRRRRNAGGAH
jgi:hypothetical protein